MCCLDPLGLFRLGWLRSNGSLANLYRQPCRQWYRCWSLLPGIIRESWSPLPAVAALVWTRTHTACAIASLPPLRESVDGLPASSADASWKVWSCRCPQIFAGTTAISPHRRCHGNARLPRTEPLPLCPARRPSLPRRLPGVLPAPRRFPSIDRIWPAKFPLACAVVAAGSGSRAYVPRLVR